MRHAAEDRALERSEPARADDQQVGLERHGGVGDARDDIAMGGVRDRFDTGLARMLGSGIGDVLRSLEVLDLEHGRGSAPAHASRTDRQDLQRRAGVPRELDRDIQRLVGGLAAVGGDQNGLHGTLLGIPSSSCPGEQSIPRIAGRRHRETHGICLRIPRTITRASAGKPQAQRACTPTRESHTATEM